MLPTSNIFKTKDYLIVKEQLGYVFKTRGKFAKHKL